MWSVHTRNETTSRRYPPGRCTPTCRHARARPAGRGGGLTTVESMRPRRGKSGGKGAAGRGPVPARSLASTCVIRQPHRCRRCRRAPTSTMRLVLSHTQGVSRPHILLLDAEDPRERRASASVSRGDLPSERSRASGRPGLAARKCGSLWRSGTYLTISAKTFVSRYRGRDDDRR